MENLIKQIKEADTVQEQAVVLAQALEKSPKSNNYNFSVLYSMYGSQEILRGDGLVWDKCITLDVNLFHYLKSLTNQELQSLFNDCTVWGIIHRFNEAGVHAPDYTPPVLCNWG